MIISGIILSTAPMVCHAGFLNNLFGLGNYQNCIEVGLKKVTTSSEIKKTYDECKKDYPDEGIVQRSNKKITRLPLVPTPKVPLVLVPLLPVVPIPAQ